MSDATEPRDCHRFREEAGEQQRARKYSFNDSPQQSRTTTEPETVLDHALPGIQDTRDGKTE
jgi:hypothetical protein